MTATLLYCHATIIYTVAVLSGAISEIQNDRA
jgi:hypothetical protein